MGIFDLFKKDGGVPTSRNPIKTVDYSVSYGIDIPVTYSDWGEGTREHIYHNSHVIHITEFGDNVTIKIGWCDQGYTFWDGDFETHTDQANKDIMICRVKERYDAAKKAQYAQMGIEDQRRALEYALSRKTKAPYEERLKKIIEKCK